jgi:thioredoxin-like negative regulator of GroEL
MRPLAILAALAALSIPLAGCLAGKAEPASVAALMGRDSWAANEAIMSAAERTGNLEVGLAAGERELAARPDNDDARIMVARLQTRAGRPEMALRSLEGMSGEATPASLLELARAVLASGSLDEAEAAIAGAEGAAATAEGQRSVKKLRAILEDLRGRHAEAQEIYESLLAERDEPQVRLNLGRSLLASKDYARSVSVLAPIIDSPRFVQARFVAAAALAGGGDKARARGLLETHIPDSEIRRILGGES